MFWKSFYEDDIQPEIQVPPPDITFAGNTGAPEMLQYWLLQYYIGTFTYVSPYFPPPPKKRILEQLHFNYRPVNFIVKLLFWSH